MILSLVVALLAVAPPQDPETGSVRGQVVSEADGAPLAHAVVEVLGAGRTLRAPSDRDGNYMLGGVPAGRRVLRAHHLGYAPVEMEVLVPPGGEVVLDIALEQQPIALGPVNVRVRAGIPNGVGDTLAAPRPELAIAAARALESTPGLAELGLGESARGVPGQEPVDPSDVLYVRGAAADLKLVLLDGAPVYAPFHLGGLVPAFGPGVLGSATLYLGGAPARYDGGLSYVMDLQTRGGRDEFHTSGALDLLSARMQVEGPIGGTRFLLAGRGVHELGRAAMLAAIPPYEFADGIIRLDAPAGEGIVSITGFANHEGVRLDSLGAGDRSGMAQWQNLATSLRYRGRIASTDAHLTAAFSTFDADLPIAGETPVMIKGAARRVRLAADFARGAGPLLLRYGASYDRLRLDYRVRSRFAPGDSLRSDKGARGEAAGAYLDASWQPAPRLRLRGGLRADVFSVDPVPVLAPRLTATWLLTDRAAITIAAGRYHQYARPPEHLFAPIDSATSGSASPPPALSVARATHLSLGLDQELMEDLRLGVEGFYKRFDGLPAASADGANASGMDLWVRRGGDGVTGWLGYSLAWIWSSKPGGLTSNDFSGRQLLTSGIAGPIGDRGRFEVRVAYGAGLPYTAVHAAPNSPDGFSGRAEDAPTLTSGGDAPPLVASTPDDPYLRVDVDLSHTWTPEWRGFAFEVTPYLRVLNALDRRDALFYRYDGDTDVRAVNPLPVLPVVGVEWRF